MNHDNSMEKVLSGIRSRPRANSEGPNIHASPAISLTPSVVNARPNKVEFTNSVGKSAFDINTTRKVAVALNLSNPSVLSQKRDRENVVCSVGNVQRRKVIVAKKKGFHVPADLDLKIDLSAIGNNTPNAVADLTSPDVNIAQGISSSLGVNKRKADQPLLIRKNSFISSEDDGGDSLIIGAKRTAIESRRNVSKAFDCPPLEHSIK